MEKINENLIAKISEYIEDVFIDRRKPKPAICQEKVCKEESRYKNKIAEQKEILALPENHIEVNEKSLYIALQEIWYTALSSGKY